MKALLIGNGIDIQYGGIEQRGNKAILERVLHNIQKNKYAELGWSSDALMNFFESSLRIVNRIIEGTWNGDYSKYYLFLRMELNRIIRTHNTKCELTSIGFEDLFLGVEVASLEMEQEEGDKFRDAAFFYMQSILLDAIYDDGRVNEIYRNFPPLLVRKLKSYDSIFTLNYDTNIDKCVDGAVPVYHLHGCFDHLKNGINDIPEKHKHMFSNGIMTWYWLEKYSNEGEDPRYGIDVFNGIEGSIDIIGISPCNDEQLFVRLCQNPKLSSCNYFYYDDYEQREIIHHLNERLRSHTTIRNVKKFWESFL